MFKLVNNDNISDFQKACEMQRIFGSKNMASLRCYGLNSDTAKFRIAYSGSEAVGAICLQGGVAAASSDGRIDPDELLEFCKQNEVAEIEGPVEEVDKLFQRGIGEKDSSWFMEYLPKEVPYSIAEMKPCTDLKDVFDVLQSSHKFYQDHYTFDTWSADTAVRVAANESEEYILEVDGRIIGCGSVGAIDDKIALVSSVAVIPEMRCLGYGSGITMFLAKRIIELGRRPALIAGYDEVAELYSKLGFTRCGKWGELYL